MVKVEIHKDFDTGDLIIEIPHGIKIRHISKNEITKNPNKKQDFKITEIRLTEELIWDNGRYLGDERFVLSTEG